MGTAGFNQGDRLARKLRSEYRNRGASLQGIGASSTSELMKRAQMGRDPGVNVSAEAFEDRCRADRASRSNMGRTSAGAYRAGEKGTAFRNARSDDFSRTAQSHVHRTDSAKSEHRFRDMSDRSQRSADDRRARFAEMEEPLGGGEAVIDEIRVERKRIPAGFLFVLAFCTVMIMLIIMSVAQIYQTTRELSGLERDVASLKETIGDLELALDEKNDIRLIEQMATASLGMVKEDSIQRKYISLSEGECIDLIEDPNAADNAGENGTGTMLSAIFSVLGDLFNFFE